MDLAITIDQRSTTPLHKQLYDELRMAILTGRLKPGERVPDARPVAIARRFAGHGHAELRTAFERGLPARGHRFRDIRRLRVARRIVEDQSGRKIPPRGGATREWAPELSRYGASIADSAPFEPPEPEAPINFKTGRPALDEFPLQQWRRLMVKHCRAKDSSMLDVNDCSMLDYASGSQGYEPLRGR